MSSYVQSELSCIVALADCFSSSVKDKERFWREQLSQVNKKYLFGGGSKSDSAKGVIGSHAYAVLEAWQCEEVSIIFLENRAIRGMAFITSANTNFAYRGKSNS